jgi:ankyrin repeat protein
MGAIGGRLDGLSLAAMKRQAIDNGDYDGGASIASNESSATTVIDTDEENCKMDLVEMLLESGADPKIGNEVRDTPLHFACEQVRINVRECSTEYLLVLTSNIRRLSLSNDVE